MFFSLLDRKLNALTRLSARLLLTPLHVMCPYCTRQTAIAGWPESARAPVLFTCLPQYGGCGGHALVEPPETGHFPHLEHVYVTPPPVSLPTQDEAP